MRYDLKKRIEELLKERRNSKKSLYDFLGMTGPGFDYMVKNDSYSAARLEQIAEFFNMSVIELAGSEKDESIKSKPDEAGMFASFEKLLNEFSILREQLAIKDNQLAAKDTQIADANKRAEGLQRTIDFLISRPSLAASSNFLNGVAAGRSVVRIHPATLVAGQVA